MFTFLIWYYFENMLPWYTTHFLFFKHFSYFYIIIRRKIQKTYEIYFNNIVNMRGYFLYLDYAPLPKNNYIQVN